MEGEREKTCCEALGSVSTSAHRANAAFTLVEMMVAVGVTGIVICRLPPDGMVIALPAKHSKLFATIGLSQKATGVVPPV